MKTTISSTTPSTLETESLVAVVLDHSNASNGTEKKPELKVATSDPAVQAAAAELLASGEVSGKPFETNLFHKPASLKAKRLLLISGGGAKRFSSYELRRIAGSAVRALKSRGIRSFAFVDPIIEPPAKNQCEPLLKAPTWGTLTLTTTVVTAKTRKLKK
jgi:leucyl aminopeptidase